MRNLVLFLTRKPFDVGVHFDDEVKKYGKMNYVKIVAQGEPEDFESIDENMERIGCIISTAGKEAHEDNDEDLMLDMLMDDVYMCSLEDDEMLETEGVGDPDCWPEEWAELIINAINDYYEHYTLVEVDKEFKINL